MRKLPTFSIRKVPSFSFPYFLRVKTHSTFDVLKKADATLVTEDVHIVARQLQYLCIHMNSSSSYSL
jgi:hypothetical protein